MLINKTEMSSETVFQNGLTRLFETTMKDLPIVNQRLHVKVFPFTHINGMRLSVALTPWAINLILLPWDQSVWKALKPGEERSVELPAGKFTFLGVDDPLLGHYQLCPLMSPLMHVDSQETAEEIAHVALLLTLKKSGLDEPVDLGPSLKAESKIRDQLSRRELFSHYFRA